MHGYEVWNGVVISLRGRRIKFSFSTFFGLLLCTPFSFTSPHPSCGLSIFRCPLTSIYHVLITTSSSVLLHKPNNLEVSCLLFFHSNKIMYFNFTYIQFLFTLQTNKSYLERSLKESEDNLREMVLSKRKDAQK